MCRRCVALLDSAEHELVGVVTQPDKPVGREQRIEAPPIKAGAGRSSRFRFFNRRESKRQKPSRKSERWQPDVIVVMAYGQILPRAVLEIPRIACLNLHASLLPRYRGAAPIQAAIVAGDNETGITVMYMDEGLDTGDILLQVAHRDCAGRNRRITSRSSGANRARRLTRSAASYSRRDRSAHSAGLRRCHLRSET